MVLQSVLSFTLSNQHFPVILRGLTHRGHLQYLMELELIELSYIQQMFITHFIAVFFLPSL